MQADYRVLLENRTSSLLCQRSPDVIVQHTSVMYEDVADAGRQTFFGHRAVSDAQCADTAADHRQIDCYTRWPGLRSLQ